MNEAKILFCEITAEVVEQAEVCPFLIAGLWHPDYCGYYGKDIGQERRRLQICEIEAVIKATEEKRLSRRAGKEPFLGEGKKDGKRETYRNVDPELRPKGDKEDAKK